MAILPTGEGDVTDPFAWASGGTPVVTIGGEPELYFGYDSYSDGAPINGPFGSITNPNTSIGTITQMVCQEGSDIIQLAIDGGVGGNPPQDAFTSLQLQDGFSNPTYNSSSASFSVVGNVSFWRWGGALPHTSGTWTMNFTPNIASLTVPPTQFSNVPQNTNYPRNGDGRFWWVGNATVSPPGAMYFIGAPDFLDGTYQLSWAITQLSSDGSLPVLEYSTNGGATFTSIDLPGDLQGLQSGVANIPIGSATGLAVQVTLTGGTPTDGATNTEVAVAVTRNYESQQTWDSPNPLDPVDYNGQVVDEPGYDNLETLQNRMMIRLGFATQVGNPPPGLIAQITEYLQSSQNYLWRTFDMLRTRRWFRWKLIPLQRTYSLLDNDENLLQGFSMDPNKTVEWAGIQDTRNVWYPLIEGIPPQLYTMIDKPWRPARYEIRGCIEVYPRPDQTYFLWLKANFGLLPLVEPTDTTTIDSELVFLFALANAKAHYGQADANNVAAQANRIRQELVATTHKTAHYVPGTIPIPPAVRPTLIQFQDNQSG